MHRCASHPGLIPPQTLPARPHACNRAANFTIPHAGSKNDRGPERKQTIFRLKLPGVGESIPGAEQKRDAASTLPLPVDEIELWRAHLTDIWCGPLTLS